MAALDRVHCASLPLPALAALADLRREPGVTVAVSGDRAWARWHPSSSSAVLTRLLPIAEVEFYGLRGGLWYRLGHALPSFGLAVESAEGLPLDRALTPLPVRPEPPENRPPEPSRLALVRDDRPRSASALRCRLDVLVRWAEMATTTTAWLGALRAARDGDRVMVLGRPLPALEGAERFWGNRALAPLGFRPEPDLPEPALLGAVGALDDALMVISAEGVEVVPSEAFQPLTRSGARLARRAANPSSFPPCKEGIEGRDHVGFEPGHDDSSFPPCKGGIEGGSERAEEPPPIPPWKGGEFC